MRQGPRHAKKNPKTIDTATNLRQILVMTASCQNTQLTPVNGWLDTAGATPPE